MVEDYLDLGEFGHGGDRVAHPIGRRDCGVIEAEFFMESHADAHNGAAFDLTFQLERIDDNPGINDHRDLIDLNDARIRIDSDLRHAGPVGTAAHHQ